MVALQTLNSPSDQLAVEMPDGSLSYAELAAASAAFAARLPAGAPLALWASATRATVIGLFAALRAGVPIIPLNPKSARGEIEHVLATGRPGALLAPASQRIAGLPTLTPREGAGAPTHDGSAVPEGDAEPALILFTSGTTGPPKGVVLRWAAIESNLAALAEAWAWSAADTVVHALPLFHVHGLVLGTIGPVRLGGSVRHLGAFDPLGVADALAGDATMLFAVPTMYRRLAAAAEQQPRVAAALGRARLLVSGSAALPAAEHVRIERLCGQRIVERYGMSETLIIAAVRADGERRAGYVGRPLPGVQLRLLGEDGNEVPADDATIGEVALSSPALFDGYLGDPQASAEAFRDGWFLTGDLGTLAPDGYLRLLGRRSTDLIKSGGYRIGAGEIEAALLEHPAVAEAAVRGVHDADLGERIVAWVVRSEGETAAERELIDHVALTLTPHKRPREIRFIEQLPRNALGKVQKRLLDA